ncbi:MAG: LysR family transcriptional regulator [Gammaproteobacteria bacterium]|nr:MAG: LysR family transcriptional regulator [Gammaproteobacteria bacterium]
MESSQLSRVNVHLLVTLQVLLAERSGSGAANRLCISQSSISKHLAQLRELFGDPLFHRTSRGLVPTPFVLELEPRINRVVAAVENLFAAEDFDLARYQGCIRLSMQESAFEFIASELTREVLSKAPGITLDTWYKDTMSLEQLNQGLLDFLILPQDVGQHPHLGVHLQHRELYRDHLVCLLRKGHPVLAGAWDRHVYLGCRHIHARDTELGRPVFERDLLVDGLQRDVAVQVPDFYTANSLCARSDLVFTTTSSWARHSTKKARLVQLPLPFASAPVIYSLIWHSRSDSIPAHVWLRSEIVRIAGKAAPRG